MFFVGTIALPTMSGGLRSSGNKGRVLTSTSRDLETHCDTHRSCFDLIDARQRFVGEFGQSSEPPLGVVSQPRRRGLHRRIIAL